MGALWRAPWRHSLEMIKIVPFYAWHILPWQTLNQRLLLILRLIPTCCIVDFMVILDITDIPMVTELGMSMERERLNLLLNLKLIPRLIPTCCMVDSMVIVDIMDIPMLMEDTISASKGRGTTKFTLLSEQRLKSKQHDSISLCIAMPYNKFLLPSKK